VIPHLEDYFVMDKRAITIDNYIKCVVKE